MKCGAQDAKVTYIKYLTMLEASTVLTIEHYVLGTNASLT
jgi:hypothetical protein